MRGLPAAGAGLARAGATSTAAREKAFTSGEAKADKTPPAERACESHGCQCRVGGQSFLANAAVQQAGQCPEAWLTQTAAVNCLSLAWAGSCFRKHLSELYQGGVTRVALECETREQDGGHLMPF